MATRLLVLDSASYTPGFIFYPGQRKSYKLFTITTFQSSSPFSAFRVCSSCCPSSLYIYLPCPLQARARSLPIPPLTSQQLGMLVGSLLMISRRLQSVGRSTIHCTTLLRELPVLV